MSVTTYLENNQLKQEFIKYHEFCLRYESIYSTVAAAEAVLDTPPVNRGRVLKTRILQIPSE